MSNEALFKFRSAKSVRNAYSQLNKALDHNILNVQKYTMCRQYITIAYLINDNLKRSKIQVSGETRDTNYAIYDNMSEIEFPHSQIYACIFIILKNINII